MKRVLFTLTILAVLGGALGARVVRRNDANRGRQTRAEPVERRSVTQVVKASGHIDPRVKVNVAAHVVARIEKLHAREGDQVVAGQPFVDLEKDTFRSVHDRARAQLAMAESSVRQAEIDLADAELKLRRARRLKDEEVVADEKLEAAELAERSARVRLDQSRESVRQAAADLQKAEDELRKTTIHAPISGRVIALNAEVGEVVVSGTMHNDASVIGVIADLSEILVEVLADETDIVQVAIGQSADVEVDALPGSVYRGKVVEIGHAGVSLQNQPDVTFFLVKILLDDPDGRLLSGMSARASIEVASHQDALVVPIEAVVYRRPVGATAAGVAASDRDERGTEVAGVDLGSAGLGSSAAADDEIEVVFVVDADGTATQRPVVIGIADTTHVEIESGVEEGDLVVTGPQRVLEDLENDERLRVVTGDEVLETRRRGLLAFEGDD